ncbi:hypothetical protein HanRHA438_Chr08g0360191 [Helianthus annuus]|nr:hypothetical protein HanRHA438_Chr08g0360191 [Helianthus annuus]
MCVLSPRLAQGVTFRFKFIFGLTPSSLFDSAKERLILMFIERFIYFIRINH